MAYPHILSRGALRGYLQNPHRRPRGRFMLTVRRRSGTRFQCAAHPASLFNSRTAGALRLSQYSGVWQVAMVMHRQE